MTHAEPQPMVTVDLTAQQRMTLQSLVRSAVTKNERSARNADKKYGRSRDTAYHDGRQQHLFDLYRALGGDPDRIDEDRQLDEQRWARQMAPGA
jgi:hypothetical protein